MEKPPIPQRKPSKVKEFLAAFAVATGIGAPAAEKVLGEEKTDSAKPKQVVRVPVERSSPRPRHEQARPIAATPEDLSTKRGPSAEIQSLAEAQPQPQAVPEQVMIRYDSTAVGNAAKNREPIDGIVQLALQLPESSDRIKFVEDLIREYESRPRQEFERLTPEQQEQVTYLREFPKAVASFLDDGPVQDHVFRRIEIGERLEIGEQNESYQDLRQAVRDQSLNEIKDVLAAYPKFDLLLQASTEERLRVLSLMESRRSLLVQMNLEPSKLEELDSQIVRLGGSLRVE